MCGKDDVVGEIEFFDGANFLTEITSETLYGLFLEDYSDSEPRAGCACPSPRSSCR